MSSKQAPDQQAGGGRGECRAVYLNDKCALAPQEMGGPRPAECLVGSGEGLGRGCTVHAERFRGSVPRGGLH